MADEIMVPGPLYPDLFDGETPIMVPVKARVYQVELTFAYLEWTRGTVFVLAYDENDAEKAAVDRLECEEEDACEIEVDCIDPLDRTPTEDELHWFKQRRASREGANTKEFR